MAHLFFVEWMDRQRSAAMHELLYERAAPIAANVSASAAEQPARDLALACLMYALRALLLSFSRPADRAIVERWFVNGTVDGFLGFAVTKNAGAGFSKAEEVVRLWACLDDVYVDCGLPRPLDGILPEERLSTDDVPKSPARRALVSGVLLEGRYYLHTTCIPLLKDISKNQPQVAVNVNGLQPEQSRVLNDLLGKFSPAAAAAAKSPQEQLKRIREREAKENSGFDSKLRALDEHMERSLTARAGSRSSRSASPIHKRPRLEDDARPSAGGSDSRRSMSTASMLSQGAVASITASTTVAATDDDMDLEDGEVIE